MKTKLANVILLSLEKAIDGYVRLEDFTYNPGLYTYGFDRKLKKAALTQTLRRLREKKLVETDFEEDKIIYKLTSLGKEFVKMSSFNEKDWDKKWRIIIFDIPEQQRHVRRVLRSKLKEWGFKQWQKSVWVTKKDIMSPPKVLIEELKAQKWIAIIESNNVLIGDSIWSDRTS